MGLLIVLAGVAAGVWGAAAIAAASPPTPTLSESPATSPTNSATETFSFTDSQSGVTFQCSLNGAAFTACTSPKTYGSPTALADGSYTFAVQAVKGSSASGSATYAWVVDRTAPTLTSINRAGATPTNAASVSWNVTFSESVKNVAISNFTLAPGGGLGGSPAVTGITGSGSLYTVTASTGTGNGSLSLNYSSKGSITDPAGNAIATNPPVTGQPYTIDRTAPPAPTITSTGPPSPTTQNTASFTFTDTEVGVSFLCKLDGGSFAACTSPATYGGLADGSHTFTVEAQDAAGNVSSGNPSRTWSVDATPPPRPTVSSGPNNKWDSSTVTFTFSDSESGVTFQCSLDLTSWQPCTSPKTYYFIPSGAHEFDVRAVDAAGNVGDYNGWKWSENGQTGTGQPFTISGSLSTPLYPGSAGQYLNLSLTNPNGIPIYVSALTVSLSVTAPNATAQHPCSATSDFSLAQYSGGYPIVLPANSTRTLQQLGYSQSQWPSVRMPDTGLNQDGCKGATLHFTYTGTAQS